LLRDKSRLVLWNPSTDQQDTLISDLQPGAIGTVGSDFVALGETRPGGNESTNVFIWSMKEKKKIQTLNSGTRAADVLTGHDATMSIAIGGMGQELIYSRAPFDSQQRFTGHSGTITDIAFNSDGSLAATSSRDGTVRVWNLAGPKQPSVELPVRKKWIESVDLSNDAMVTVVETGEMQIWDTATWKSRLAFQLFENFTGNNSYWIKHGRFVNGQKYFVASSGSTSSVKLIDLSRVSALLSAQTRAVASETRARTGLVVKDDDLIAANE
jgi:WD40 repeat protein